MNIDHVYLTVTDVQAAGAFLEKYFEMRRAGGKAGMAFLTDDSGFVLTLMKAGPIKGVAWPGNFHIGFFVESKATVDEINQRLRADGYDVAPPERTHAYNFYVNAPGGFTVRLGA